MAKYTATATKAQSHVDYLFNLTNGLNDDARNEALFHLACIMNLGFRCNPRPAQGVIRKNALEIAFRNYPQVKFNFTEVKGYNGKTFNALNITVINPIFGADVSDPNQAIHKYMDGSEE